MAATKLIPYKVQLHRQGEPDDLWNLQDLGQYETHIQRDITSMESGSTPVDADTFAELFTAFCDEQEGSLADLGERFDQFDNVTLEVSEEWAADEQVVEGNLYLGNYGVARNLVDRQSGVRQERGRDVDTSEEKPLYFMAYMPRGNPTTAYIILERSRRYGLKKPIHWAFADWVQNAYADELGVSMKPVTTPAIFEKLEDADRTTRLRLEKERRPADLHDAFGPVFDQSEMRQAIEFRPSSGGDMGVVVDELRAWYESEDDAFEEIDGVAYNNVKLTVETDGSEETISLTKGEAPVRKTVDLDSVAEEADLPVLSEMSRTAHGFLTTVTGGETGTTSLFE
ncbi:hypothetical protein NDI56_21015 [Haloarcula sp. S1CR25-12]|uniref:Uncharacterized protein n=1 Tax=Haloarcula saliterrae TaxID=2950534 RepID=A0ABU2FJK7_9EURY|nr:hypothetical protein [Haloarcula sp. S1CR25-12]MDS0261890.1 hypothetical protein [Haloarcula sp. S1CR25-12]